MQQNDARWALCVAPMIDVTDRHCRYFHRLLAPQARLYTEMLSTAAFEYGDKQRSLAFDAAEHPLAVQLGCSDPQGLAAAARLLARRGYDEVNSNCGCPAARVPGGHVGGILVQHVQLVAAG